MTTGEKIRHYRTKAGLTQKQLGEKSGIAEPTIRKYELGKLNPKYTTLEKIANALNISPTMLMEKSIDMEKIIANIVSAISTQNELSELLLEILGQEAMDIVDIYTSGSENQKAIIWNFSQQDEHTQDLFHKYTTLDKRGKKTVENVIISEYMSVHKEE